MSPDYSATSLLLLAQRSTLGRQAGECRWAWNAEASAHAHGRAVVLDWLGPATVGSRSMSALERFLLIVGCAIVVASCGGGGGGGATSSSSISPTQYANSQRDVGYLRAVNQITAAFNKAPANPTDETGRRELRAAIHGLNSLSVPPVFVAAQAHLISALRADEALAPRFERAARAGDRVAQNNLEAQNIRDQTAMNNSLREMAKTYDKCRTSKFAAC
jgi:hypothetical protein